MRLKKKKNIHAFQGQGNPPFSLSLALLPPPHLNLKKEVLDRSKWDLLKTALENLVYIIQR